MIKFKELYERVVGVVQRKKMARRMAKMAKSTAFQFKKQKAMLKMRNPAKLALAARKKAMQSYRDKLYPNYKDMPLPQRVKVDQLITQKYGAKIDKIAKKMAMKLKKAEVERIKKAKEKMKEK